MTKYHIPVMLTQCLDGLCIVPDGVYVDATYGGGGHSAEILKQLTTGKLIAFDQDNDAVKRVQDHPNLIFVDHNFQYIKNFLKFYEIEKVNGILADLGISSHQIDEGGRGFSFRADAPLDMRMNQEQTVSAKSVINTYQEAELYRIFKVYGEVKFARKLAAKIVSRRGQMPIETTGELASMAEEFIPAKQRNKELAQLFQAIRIEVNGELNSLKILLEKSAEVLKPGGRLVVMSYHSLEDRMVKNFINCGNIEGDVVSDSFGNVDKPFAAVNRKPIVADEQEQAENPRSRSAKLRIAERL
ncbi:MAG: 16S rRNA (cytosine(1402)-N(4))-methyltransferase RsmH [Flavobacteriales bacterium]|nr:16S rRNA (cytosine(1402)-N(4))-methyltransferase RsmH [Flavobacteriales bacterium]